MTARIYFQNGSGKGRKILLVGESPSPKGWHNGKSCGWKNGILPTGKRINECLESFKLTADECGFTELCQKILKNRKQIRARAKMDWPVFLSHVKKSKCKLIIVLGVETASVFSGLCGYSLKTGEILSVKLGAKTYSVLTIYHPSPINPKNHAKNKRIIFIHKKKILGFLQKV